MENDILMVLPTRSIANVVSNLFHRIASRRLFAQQIGKIGSRNAIAASRARKLRNVRDTFSTPWFLDFTHDP